MVRTSYRTDEKKIHGERSKWRTILLGKQGEGVTTNFGLMRSTIQIVQHTKVKLVKGEMANQKSGEMVNNTKWRGQLNR